MKKLAFSPLARRLLPLIGVLLMVIQPSVALAISPTDKKAVDNDTVYYDPGFTANICSGSSGHPGPIVLIGDSLMVGMSDHGIGQKLQTAGWTPTIDGVVSRPLSNPSFSPTDGLGAIDAQQQTIKTATAVVMELGTNPSGGDFGQQVTQAIAKIRALNATAVIYWINIGAVTNPAYSQYNQILNNLSGPNNFKVIDWFKLAYPNGDETNVNPSLSSPYIPAGNVHPSPAGYDAMVNLVVSTITGGSTQAAPESVNAATPGLPPDVQSAITKLQPLYQQAAAQTSIPWQLLAAIHYREHGNAQDNPGNGNGPYQILGTTYPAGPVSNDVFVQESIAAANFIRGKQNSNTPPHRVPLNASSNDPEVIKDYLYSYNGRAGVYAQQAALLGFDPISQPYEGSPYVMNNFDAKHMNMQMITHDGGGLSGTDTRFGAYVIYARLLGLGGNATCSAQ